MTKKLSINSMWEFFPQFVAYQCLGCLNGNGNYIKCWFEAEYTVNRNYKINF